MKIRDIVWCVVNFCRCLVICKWEFSFIVYYIYWIVCYYVYIFSGGVEVISKEVDFREVRCIVDILFK